MDESNERAYIELIQGVSDISRTNISAAREAYNQKIKPIENIIDSMGKRSTERIMKDDLAKLRRRLRTSG